MSNEGGNGAPPTRGGVAGASRGGGMTVRGNLSGPPKMPAQLSGELAKKQLEAKRKLNQLAKQRMTVGDFSKYATDVNSRMISFSVRIEAMILTLNRMFPEFDKTYRDSEFRILQWRELVQEIENSGMSLKDFRDKVITWNADNNNPNINITCFRPEFVKKTFSVENPDATLEIEEKMKFMYDLGFSQEYIESKIGTKVASDPSEAEGSQEKGQDDPSEGSPEVPESVS